MSKYNIIVYGYGLVGKAYYNWFVNGSKANVMFYIDRNYKNLKNDFVQVFPLEKMKTVKPNDYDYLIIAIDDKNICDQVKKQLSNYNVPMNKVLETRYRQIYDEDIFWKKNHLRQYFRDNYYVGKLLNCKEFKCFFGFVFDRIEEIKDDEKKAKLLKTAISEINDKNAKIAAIRFLYEMDLFDSENTREYMNALLTMDYEDDTPYYMLLDSYKFTFFHKENRYREFCLDKIEVLKKVCNYYGLKPQPKINKPDKKRVLLVCFKYNYNVAEAYEKLILRYGMGFIKEGYEVHLLITQARYCGTNSDVSMLPYLACTESELEYKNDDVLMQSGIIVHASDIGDVQKRLKKNIEIVFGINPYFILDFAAGWCPEMYIIQKYFPKVQLPVEGDNFSSFFDTFITRSIEQTKQICYGIEADKLIEVNLGNMMEKEEEVPYSREQFGFNEDDFILVTVGSRLNYEIEDDLVRSFKKIAVLNSRIKWVLVGERVDLKNDDFCEMEAQGSIVQHGYEPHLESFYKLCNVYLQPNRTGGGVSIRQAMREHLPIAMTDYPADSKPIAVKKHIVKGDYNKLMEYIYMLYKNKKKYEEACCESYEKISTLSPENDVKTVLEICNNTAKKCWAEKRDSGEYVALIKNR